MVDTEAAIRALKSGTIGTLGLDVYDEADLFFEDLSEQVIKDDSFARLLTVPNAIITGHQGVFTRNVLRNFADTTPGNITEYEESGESKNEVKLERLKRSA